MKNILFFLFLLFLSPLACTGPESDCKEPQIPKIMVGFHRTAGDPGYFMPVDTVFSSVYVPGVEAEMRGRRIGDQYYLPVPAKGGEVMYVFEQGSRRDTLALEVRIEAVIEDTGCPAKVRVTNVVVLPGKTSYPSGSVSIGNPYSYGNEAKVSIAVP